MTNAAMRENYLECRNPDRCTDKVILGLALPKSFKAQTPLSYAIILLYGWGLVVIVPGFVGHWWTGPRKTDKGLSPQTGYLFFRFALEKKGTSFEDLIQLLCQTEEIQKEVEDLRDKFYLVSNPDFPQKWATVDSISS